MDKNITRLQTGPFTVEGSNQELKEHLDTGRVFQSVDEEINWTQTIANIKLRDRLVWFCMLSFAGEIFLLFLFSALRIQLPNSVVIAVSTSMGGSSLGLGGLLYFIAKDLFSGKR